MPGSRELPRRPARRRLVPVFIAAAVLFWIPIELHLSNNAPRTEHVTLRSSRLPEAFGGFRIVVLSDLHEKSFGSGNETLLRMVRAADPGVIAITGDLIDSEAGMSYAEALFPKLTAIAPVFYVTGNHEWAADGKTASAGSNRLISRLERCVTASGAVWLDSSFQLFDHNGSSILLAGLSDPINRAAPNVRALRQNIDEHHGGEVFSVLLSHRHDIDYSASGFDAVLAGHAHGGVVRVPLAGGLIGPNREWFPKYTSGIYTIGSLQLVVSRGLGDTYAPRFLNRPQVLVVTLSN
jgi:hypothetical protein